MVISSSELFSVEGKTALVTGASSGLGREFALFLASEKTNVVLVARRTEKLQLLVDEISAMGKGKVTAITLDVASEEPVVEKAIDEAWSAFGKIDILVNNAGMGIVKSLSESTSSDFDTQFSINVKGLWLLTQKVSKRMIANGVRGSIINISSVAGDRVGTLHNGKLGIYSATKSAVNMLTECFASELGPKGIRVNAILPGVFPSEATKDFVHLESTKEAMKNLPLSRVGDSSKDLYGVLLLLASEASAYMTGAKLTVDGGWSICSPSFVQI